MIHMPNCPSRPLLHFNSICMSKAAESLRGNQPQRHIVSVFSASLELLKHHRSLEKANQRASTGPLWEEKRALILTQCKMPAPTGAPLYTAGIICITGRTHDPAAHRDQSMNFLPIHHCHQAESSPKANESLSPCFRRTI